MKSILIIFFTFFIIIFACKQEMNRITENEISFKSNNLSIPATLTLPAGGDKPFPAVILVHGSGLIDRDCSYKENGLEIKPFKEIADALAKTGIASLRYDKRSYIMHNKSEYQDDLLKTMPEDFINDAKAGIEYLKNHPKIAKSKIFLIAHSQGGSFAPYISKNMGLKGAILLAPGLLKVREQITYQLDYQMKFFTKQNAYGLYDEIIQNIKNYQNKYASALKLYDEKKIPEKGFIIGMTKPFFEAYNELTLNVSENISTMDIPVLLINGDMDLKCPKELVERFKHILFKKADLEIYYINNMTHILNFSGTMVFHQHLNEKIIIWLKNKIK